MASKTKIEWTSTVNTDGTTTQGSTWNPIRGCTRISPGCVNCYAERMAARGLPGLNSPTTGNPFAVMTESGPRWTSEVELIESMMDAPLRWRKPRTIFVNSISDTFHERVPDEWIDQIFTVMVRCPQHRFLVLTKRTERMARYVNTKPLPNVWLGTSVEDQQRADERIPHLLQTPAAVRFLSVEPLLGPVDLSRIEYNPPESSGGSIFIDSLRGHGCSVGGSWQIPKLDWVIIGGESGPGARPCAVEWVRSIVRECREARVPCFVKQLGAQPTMDGKRIRLSDPKGGDMAEWPDDLRVREMPEAAR